TLASGTPRGACAVLFTPLSQCSGLGRSPVPLVPEGCGGRVSLGPVTSRVVMPSGEERGLAGLRPALGLGTWNRSLRAASRSWRRAGGPDGRFVNEAGSPDVVAPVGFGAVRADRGRVLERGGVAQGAAGRPAVAGTAGGRPGGG